MTDRLLDKYTKDGMRHESDSESAGDGPEEIGCFGWLRGIRDRAIMLELRKKNGHCMAIGYGWIERVEYDPDHGITLHLANHTVRITGSGLNTEIRPAMRLYDGIVRHRVSWVREASRSESLGNSQNGVWIDLLEWEG